jgi:uncharacterized membrane protein
VKIGRQLWVCAFALGAMLAIAAAALLQTSQHDFAVRWDLHGQPIGYWPTWAAVLITPAVAAILCAGFALAPRILPPGTLNRSAAAWIATWNAALIAMCAGQAAVVALNLGVHIDMPRFGALLAAMVIALIGNYMGKVRYNYMLGLRTPWTLSDQRVWDKTHRFLGRAMVGAAVLLTAATFLTPTGRASDVWMLVEILAFALAPLGAAIVYSIRITPRSENGAAH